MLYKTIESGYDITINAGAIANLIFVVITNRQVR